MERTLIKSGYFWRKSSAKDGCKGNSESALICYSFTLPTTMPVIKYLCRSG